MSKTELSVYILLVVVFAACTTPQRDLLTEKKWLGTKVDLPKSLQNAKLMDFDSQIVQYKRDSVGLIKWRQLKIDWNNDSDRVFVESNFTYYRKGNSLFVKHYFSKEFYEERIKELTDSTLALEIPKGGGVVFHYTAQTK